MLDVQLELIFTLVWLKSLCSLLWREKCLPKRFKNNLSIFVFVFRLNGGLNYIICRFLFVVNFIYGGAAVIVFGTLISECVYSQSFVMLFGKGLLLLEIFFCQKIGWITMILWIVGFGGWHLVDSVSFCVCI